MGYALPPGTVVATQAWSMHRDPSVFPSPDTFLPERWLESSSTTSDHLTTMAAHMMPFGTGSRVCGGQNLAQVMLRIAVTSFARNFDVSAPPETHERSMDIKDSFVRHFALRKHLSLIDFSRSSFQLRWSANFSSHRVDNECDTSYTHLDYLFFTNPVFTVYSLPCLSMFMAWSFLYLAFLLVCFIFLFDAGPSLAGKLGWRLYMHLLHNRHSSAACGNHHVLFISDPFHPKFSTIRLGFPIILQGPTRTYSYLPFLFNLFPFYPALTLIV